MTLLTKKLYISKLESIIKFLFLSIKKKKPPGKGAEKQGEKYQVL